MTVLCDFSVGYVRLRRAGYWPSDDDVAAETAGHRVASAGPDGAKDRHVTLIQRIVEEEQNQQQPTTPTTATTTLRRKSH